MITEAVQQITSLFSRRFFFNALLPTFVFTSFTLAVVILGGGATSVWLGRWGNLDLLARLLIVFAYIAFIYLLAAAVASQWRNIVRLFEGYPLVAVARKLGFVPVGTRWHQQRMKELLSESHLGRPDQAYYKYPPEGYLSKLLPTRLGNILLAGERYPRDRYGIDAIYFWPRLFPLLPEAFQRDYELAVIQYQFPLVVAFQSGFSTLLCSAILLGQQAPPLFFLGVLVGGFALSYAAYALSLMSAVEVSEIQRSAFDLYRERLLMAWPSVQDVTDERAAFRRIRAFVVQGAQPAWGKNHDAYTSRHREDQATVIEVKGQRMP